MIDILQSVFLPSHRLFPRYSETISQSFLLVISFVVVVVVVVVAYVVYRTGHEL